MSSILIGRSIKSITYAAAPVSIISNSAFLDLENAAATRSNGISPLYSVVIRCEVCPISCRPTARTLAGTGDALQSPVTQGALKAAGKATQASVAAQSQDEPWIPVKLSDGRTFEVHPEDLDELKRRDPKLQRLDNQDNQ